MSNPAKLMPNLNQQSTKMLNLTVLQRMDPNIEEILMTAAHVTLYDFNIDLNHWVSFSLLILTVCLCVCFFVIEVLYVELYGNTVILCKFVCCADYCCLFRLVNEIEIKKLCVLVEMNSVVNIKA